MPRKLKTLRVCANPFVHLDHDGRPAAAAAYDADFHSPDRRHVGARHQAELIEARAPVDIQNVTGDGRPNLHEIWFEFDHEPQTVPDTPHYRELMKPSVDGGPALIPANEATAKAIGVAFRDPSQVVIDTAHAMAERWAKDHDGEIPAWADPDIKHDDLHPSHKTHRALYGAHLAKLPEGKPPVAPPPPPPPSTPAAEHEVTP